MVLLRISQRISQRLFKKLFQALTKIFSQKPTDPQRYQEIAQRKLARQQAAQRKLARQKGLRWKRARKKLARRDEFNKAQVEFSLALAGFLLAIPTILITTFPSFQPVVDDLGVASGHIVPLVGVFSIYGAASIIDYWLDEFDKSFCERLCMFGGGYTIFCILVSLMAVSLWILAAQQKEIEITPMQLRLYGLTGGLMFIKFMVVDRQKVEFWKINLSVEFCGMLLRIALAIAFCNTVFGWSPLEI